MTKNAFAFLMFFLVACSNHSEQEWKVISIGETKFQITIPNDFESEYSARKIGKDLIDHRFYASNKSGSRNIVIGITEYPDQYGQVPQEISLSCDPSGNSPLNLTIQSEQAVTILGQKTKLITCVSDEANVYITSLFKNYSHFTLVVSDHSAQESFDLGHFLKGLLYQQ